MSAPGYTVDELLACLVARELRDGDRVFVGPQPAFLRCGGLLAHLDHGPDMRVAIGLVVTNLLGEERPPHPETAADHRLWTRAESVVVHERIFERPDACSNVFFTSGLQVDRHANVNLIGTLGPDGQLAVRGPGSLGAPSMAHYARRYYVLVPVHEPRVLVERCDLVSVVGHGEGGDHRARLGLDRRNGGPSAVITPLAVLDCETPDRSLRLRSVHPGVTVAEVRAATGFELAAPATVPVTEPPRPGELAVLRGRIDVAGELRRAAPADR